MTTCTNHDDLLRLERRLDKALDAVASATLLQWFLGGYPGTPARYCDIRDHLLNAIEAVRATIDDCNPVLPRDRTFCNLSAEDGND